MTALLRTYENTKAILARIHRDEQGDQGLEKLLIIAALALPLLGILILYGDELKEWLADKWDDIRGRSDDLDPGSL